MELWVGKNNVASKQEIKAIQVLEDLGEVEKGGPIPQMSEGIEQAKDNMGMFGFKKGSGRKSASTFLRVTLMVPERESLLPSPSV